MNLLSLKNAVKKVGIGFCFIMFISIVGFIMLSTMIIVGKYTQKPQKVSDAISICKQKYMWYKDEDTCKVLLRKNHGITL